MRGSTCPLGIRTRSASRRWFQSRGGSLIPEAFQDTQELHRGRIAFRVDLLERDGVLIPPVFEGGDDLLAVGSNVGAQPGGRRHHSWLGEERGRVPGLL